MLALQIATIFSPVFLRARCVRLSGDRAAKKRDEVPPPHGLRLHAEDHTLAYRWARKGLCVAETSARSCRRWVGACREPVQSSIKSRHRSCRLGGPFRAQIWTFRDAEPLKRGLLTQRMCSLNSPGVILVARRNARVKLACEEKPDRKAISLKGSLPAPIIVFAAVRRCWLT
jgi:ribosomal protein L36